MAAVKPSEKARIINEFVDANREDLPFLEECCLDNGWDYDDLLKEAKRCKSLNIAVRRLVCRQVLNLKKGGIFGKYSKPMVVLLLQDIFRESAQEQELEAFERLDRLLGIEVSLAKAETDEEDG